MTITMEEFCDLYLFEIGLVGASNSDLLLNLAEWLSDSTKPWFERILNCVHPDWYNIIHFAKYL